MACRYHQGRAFEYEVRDALLERGFTCIRSAGSKGSIDLIAGNGAMVIAVQCKRNGSLPRKERTRFWHDAMDFLALPVLALKDRGVKLFVVKQTGKIACDANKFDLDNDL